MRKKGKLNAGRQHLIRRYLLWAYKSTKESFERIERKTTQLTVDEFILKYLFKHKYEIPPAFKTYISDKRKDELKLKFVDGDKQKLHPEYVYLKDRLEAIEAAIAYFLGAKELRQIQELYEKEFTRRILEARDH